MRRTKPAEQRFWAKVRKDEDGCWEWTAHTNPNGYGQFSISTTLRDKLAHRVSFEMANGPIPDGLSVCHHCDNPKCVRPDHLFLGTHSDNMKDCYKKGRLVLPLGGRFKKAG